MSTRAEHLSAALKAADTAQDLAQAGEYEGAAAYAAVAQAYAAVASAWDDAEPVALVKPREPLPEWCGKCDGSPLAQRWVNVPGGPGERPSVVRCSRCNPHAEMYQPKVS